MPSQLLQVAASAPCRSVFVWPGIQWLEPVQISARTIGTLASRTETKQSVLATMEELTEDDYLTYLKGYYRAGIDRFGADWDYADLLTFLQASTTLLQPRNYLEIGVRRGRSMCIVAKANPECQLYGFDLWVPDYAGMPNPGPDFVQAEVTQVGHGGDLQLISGNSHKTVPAFLAANPDLQFDLINVDGDHSEAGARSDLAVVLPRLQIGGAILLDDIVHPQHKYLESIWDELVGSNDRYGSYKYRDLGYGVAVAVRRY
jgi:predicted O-methyltransferase YrrM